MSALSEEPVKTFTIGFSEAGYDERAYASVAAQAFATTHHQKLVEPSDFETVRMLVRHAGEPYADSSILPTYFLSQFTREHVTVALSGDGADELFGGYWRYTLMHLIRSLDAVPQNLRKPLANALGRCVGGTVNERTLRGKIARLCRLAAAPAPNRYLSIISRVTEEKKQQLYGPRMTGFTPSPSTAWLLKHLSEEPLAPGELESALDLLTYLPCDVLPKVDFASMAASLEVRSPFLDPEIVDFATSLPWHCKQHHGKRKRILIAAFHDLLPRSLQKRGKAGFGVPLASWFRTTWTEPLRDVLLSRQAADRGFFDPRAVRQLVTEHVDSTRDHSYLLWSLLVFELWCDEFGIS